jgi:hypothetical protein
MHIFLAYFCIFLTYNCIFMQKESIFLHITAYFAFFRLHILTYFYIYLHIYAETFKICNLASPVSGHSRSIPASPICAPTTTDLCQHCMASQRTRSCPIRATPQQAVEPADLAGSPLPAGPGPGTRPAQSDHVPFFPAAGLCHYRPIHCHISNCAITYDLSIKMQHRSIYGKC